MLSSSRVLVVAAAAALPSVAVAAPSAAAEAEHTRLAEEMRNLAQRSAWRGVDAAYLRMLPLVKKGVVLTVEDHYLASQAARDLGRINVQYTRLLRAEAHADAKTIPEVASSLEQIRATFGEVSLGYDPKFPESRSLSIAVQPFAADQRNAIAVAQKKLEQNGEFEGLLPYGKYSYGPLDFELTPESGKIERYLSNALAKRGNASTAKRRDGLRISLGPQYQVVGSPSDAGTGLPDGFSRPGLRAGVGWEIELVEHLGLVVEAGYAGTFNKSIPGGETVITEQNGFYVGSTTPEAKQALQTFYVWGGPTYFVGEFAVSVGPAWSAGRVASSTADVGGVEVLDDYSGAMKAGGGTLSLFYGLFDTPGLSRSRSGLSLTGGALTDLDRAYPWGQLAFTVAPAN
jgi:hypothetical protein